MTSAGVVICSCHGEKLVFVGSKLIWPEEKEENRRVMDHWAFFICIYIQNAVCYFKDRKIQIGIKQNEIKQ